MWFKSEAGCRQSFMVAILPQLLQSCCFLLSDSPSEG